MFIIYLKDLLTKVADNDIVSYADDSAVITAGETREVTINKMNKLSAEIDVWLAANKLTLNANKTIYITFGNYCDSVPINLEVKIKDKLLDRVEYCRYLGVIIDYNSKWNEHIKYLVNKTKNLTFAFCRLSKFMENRTLMVTYSQYCKL